MLLHVLWRVIIKRVILMFMGDLTRLTGLISIFFPFFIFVCLSIVSKKTGRNNRVVRIILFCACCCAILYYTLFKREVGADHQINMMPFWSYFRWNKLDVRWQVYMNIFLFIPFGFMLEYVSGWSFIKVLIIGLLLSAAIEAVQYVFCIGLCEFDDVFHNTLGTVIGYWYYRGLEWGWRKILKKQ